MRLDIFKSSIHNFKCAHTLLKFDSESHLNSLGKIASYTLPLKKKSPHLSCCIQDELLHDVSSPDTVLLTGYLLQIGMTHSVLDDQSAESLYCTMVLP